MFFTTRLKLKVESDAEPTSNVSFSMSGIGPLKFVRVTPGLRLFRFRKLFVRFRFAGLAAPEAVTGVSDMRNKNLMGHLQKTTVIGVADSRVFDIGRSRCRTLRQEG